MPWRYALFVTPIDTRWRVSVLDDGRAPMGPLVGESPSALAALLRYQPGKENEVASKYKKSDLDGTYKWTAIDGDDPRVSGEPDSTLFNRHEGYEVLYLLNKFVAKHGLNQASFLRAEKMLEHLPSTVRSQVRVVTWLETNWKNKSY